MRPSLPLSVLLLAAVLAASGCKHRPDVPATDDTTVVVRPDTVGRPDSQPPVIVPTDSATADSAVAEDTAGHSIDPDSAQVLDTVPSESMPSVDPDTIAAFRHAREAGRPPRRPRDTARTSATAEATDTTVTPRAAGGYTGIPFGPFSLWSSSTSFKFGPSPWNASIDAPAPSGICTQIAYARSKGQRLNTFLAGGAHSTLKTDGHFDLAKWRARINLFANATVKQCIAAGVADGTVFGASLVDEPEVKDWGRRSDGTSWIDKAMLTGMAQYVKAIFPTLPVGVNHGPPGYQWRAREKYGAAVDFVHYQYAYNVSKGDVVGWRNKVLAQALYDGVRPLFGENYRDGGQLDTSGAWDCPQSRPGSYAGRCWMTPDQVATYGKALAPYACALHGWHYTQDQFSRPAYVDALRQVRAVTDAQPNPGPCRRPGT